MEIFWPSKEKATFIRKLSSKLPSLFQCFSKLFKPLERRLVSKTNLRRAQARNFSIGSRIIKQWYNTGYHTQSESILVFLPLQTALCNTVLDNPQNRSKIDLVNHIVNCLEMDTVLFYSSVRKHFRTNLQVPPRNMIQQYDVSVTMMIRDCRKWMNYTRYKLKSGGL